MSANIIRLLDEIVRTERSGSRNTTVSREFLEELGIDLLHALDAWVTLYLNPAADLSGPFPQFPEEIISVLRPHAAYVFEKLFGSA